MRIPTVIACNSSAFFVFAATLLGRFAGFVMAQMPNVAFDASGARSFLAQRKSVNNKFLMRCYGIRTESHVICYQDTTIWVDRQPEFQELDSKKK
jgi:hypothetical protein